LSPQRPRPAHPLAVAATGLLRPGRPDGVARAQALADPARVRRILIVKPHDQLGDFLMATPLLAALRARHRDATIALVTRAYLAPLAVRQPALDRVWTLPGDLWRVSLFHPNVAFVLNSVSRSRTADLVAASSGARLVVGRSAVGAGDVLGEASGARDPVYDLDVAIAPGSVHQTARLLDFMRALEPGPAPFLSPPRMTLVLRERERAAGERMISALLPGAVGRRIGIHPAAANPLKCWPVSSFVDLGARLARDGAAQVFVFDTPKDPGPARAVVEGLAAQGVRAALAPAGPLASFAAACAALDLLVCNDSGVLHVAAALGVPTLSFHSLGRPAEWAPQSATAIALHGEPIAAVTVADAERAARRLLAPAS
jgi:ADP-heptose:LPS heptosyltransferase